MSLREGHLEAKALPPKARRCLFKEQLIYEQSRARTAREQQEKRPCGWSRRPLKLNSYAATAIASTPPGAANCNSALHTLHYVSPRSNTHGEFSTQS